MLTMFMAAGMLLLWGVGMRKCDRCVRVRHRGNSVSRLSEEPNL